LTEIGSKQDFYSKGYYKGFTPEPRFAKVANIFLKLKGANFLDIGCGDGDITLFLKEKMNAINCYGIEISQEAAFEAKKKGVEAYNMDIDKSDLPFKDNFFDVIYCGEIIEHVFDTDHLLEEAFRVLKLGGTCILTTPNLAGWSSRFALLFGYQPYPMAASPKHESAGKLLIKGDQGQWGHIRVLTLGALKEIVTLHGFSVTQVIGCRVTIKNSGSTSLSIKLVNHIDELLSRAPQLSTRVILVLKK
jgi:methionine biosynthesis protein MetW